MASSRDPVVGPDRRRRFDDVEKQALMMAAFAPGAKVADVARRAGVRTGVLYRWRAAQSAAMRGPGFVRAKLIDASAPPAVCAGPAIVVDLAGGVRVSLGAGATAEIVAIVLRALR